MTFPRYSSYRDSGIDWLGQLPDTWHIKKFRYLFTESSEKIESTVIGSMLSVSGYRGVELKEYADENQKRTDEDLVGYRIVHPGQLVVNTMWLNYSGLGISQFTGHVSPAYRAYWIDESLHKPFVHYLLRSSLYVLGYTKYLTGVRPNSLQMSREDLMNFPIIIPSNSEQRAIAIFLDRETHKIDSLIAEQEKLIQLLKEKREEVISHVVTKGLDPNVKMKESGVEWFSQIPEHWQVTKLKYATSNIKAGPFGSAITKDMYTNSGYRVYGQEQVIPSDFSVGDYYIDENKFQELKQYEVRPFDILISCVGTFGKIAVVPENIEAGIINPRLIRLRVNDKVEPNFLLENLRSKVVFQQLSSATRGGTMDTITIGTLSQVLIAIPPLVEQIAIIHEIEANNKKFDVLISESKRAIEILQERRSALVTAAVTGQIDVKNVAPQMETA